jgi:hypothetical protein
MEFDATAGLVFAPAEQGIPSFHPQNGQQKVSQNNPHILSWGWMNNSSVGLLNYPRWEVNSATVFFVKDAAILWFAIFLSVACLLHSAYIRGRSWPTTRIWTDLASCMLLCQCICFLSCFNGRCDLYWTTIVNNILGNSVFGMICQTCDNYQTFVRFELLIGRENLTNRHRYAAFLYYIVMLDLTWILFPTVLPYWYDLNTPIWIDAAALWAGWITLGAFAAYDVFYLTWVLLLIFQNEQDLAAKQSPAMLNMKRKFDSLSSRQLSELVFRNSDRVESIDAPKHATFIAPVFFSFSPSLLFFFHPLSLVLVFLYPPMPTFSSLQTCMSNSQVGDAGHYAHDV